MLRPAVQCLDGDLWGSVTVPRGSTIPYPQDILCVTVVGKGLFRDEDGSSWAFRVPAMFWKVPHFLWRVHGREDYGHGMP